LKQQVGAALVFVSFGLVCGPLVGLHTLKCSGMGEVLAMCVRTCHYGSERTFSRLDFLFVQIYKILYFSLEILILGLVDLQ